MSVTPVPFDARLAEAFATLPPPHPVPRVEEIPAQREELSEPWWPTDAVIGDRPVDAEDRTIPGPPGEPELEITIFRPRGLDHRVPGLYNIHGGGTIKDSRFVDNPRLVELVEALGVVIVNVDYRLAPENPDPAPVEDCYAGFVWMVENAHELSVDPDRIVVMGGSAGGGLSAGVSLLARDRGGPSPAGQLLLCPMLDDRHTTPSSHQYPQGLGTWSRQMSEVAWRALLGEKAGDPQADVSVYAAPARASDLSGLAPAFIEAGSAELFRDEDVDYASRIWAVGGQAELHIWSGGFHGFDMVVPDHPMTAAAKATRLSWLNRILEL